jgi:flagellar hook-associated protein 3 FlgL
MRISTQQITNSALSNILAQQAQLSKTQGQIATGTRVQTPADDPIAAVHILELQRALRESEQFGKNADAANNRLVLEEQALQDLGSLVQSVQERAVQGNNATVGGADRRLIATEIRQRLSELVDIANRRDATGEFLFSGYATRTQPFAQTGGTVIYQGDQGGRSLQIGPNQRIADSHSGYEVFLSTPEGNGTFVTAASGANTGTGVIAGGSVVNPAQYVADDYTLRFTSAAGAYEIVDSNAAVVSTGTYTADSAIAFRGVSISLRGTPAANDTFSIDRARTEDLFTTVGKLADALESTTITPAQRAQFNSEMAQVLVQLDTAQDRLLGVRSEVGSRLATLESAQASRADQEVELQRITSELRDVDYAEAITRMNQQLVGLQAAQQSYSRIAQLSLFDYLR